MPVGRLCAQSDALGDQGRVESDNFFQYLRKTEGLLDDYRRNADDRVKIAIIDSGIDLTHPQVGKLQVDTRGWQRVTSRSFVDGVPDGEDRVGHGTHISVTVMRIAKWSEVYVATVVDTQGNVNAQSVAKALNYSIDEWEVDIISMSLGFDRGDYRINEALKKADREDILVFAAVSNDGAAALRLIAWPASMTKVFGINSAKFDGVTSSFNPPENDNDAFSRYKFLGEGVRSAWPLHLGDGEEKTLTGTSMATPIAAATTALFIEFIRQNADDEEAGLDAEIMETPDGMREIFHLIGIAKSKGEYLKYVTPWHLLHTATDSVQTDRRRALHRIHQALLDLHVEKTGEHDTAIEPQQGREIEMLSLDRRVLSKSDMRARVQRTPSTGRRNPTMASRRPGTTDRDMAITPRQSNDSVRPVKDEDIGLRVLYEPSEPQFTKCQTQIIDIVAIHGIGAHPDDTWCKDVGTYENGSLCVNWLKDKKMLPSQVPNARILRYGYMSQWFGANAIRQKTATVADRLLRALKRDRKIPSPQSRPLIFIAHCFGGLAVLKALLIAEQFPEDWPGIYSSTTGLIFLGTPFRGAPGLTQNEMIQAVEASYADTVQGEILRILDPDDESLQEMLHTFEKSRGDRQTELRLLVSSSKYHVM